ncbi:MAG: expansin EXLX1 family cellulose-binding protein, partial [Myxococcota bacterium]
MNEVKRFSCTSLVYSGIVSQLSTRVVVAAALCLFSACGEDAGQGDPQGTAAAAGAGGSGSTGEGGAAGTGGAGGEVHSGEGTFYGADGSGNCSFDPSPHDLMVAAMNESDYAGSEACGGCIHVVGPDGEVTVRIVDRCPECAPGDVDLSAEAFAQIADPADGRVPITWTDVRCEVSGPIVYRFKEGSSRWWTAIQVRNTRWAVRSLEVKIGGSYVEVPREMYNYFVYAAGMGEGPYDLRVTDIRGQVLEDTGIA